MIKIHSDSTLFLDRDGVINVRRVGNYLARWEDFKYLDRADEAMIILAAIFPRIIVVTNQQGVAKGLTTVFEIDHLHYCLNRDITGKGGRIDKIYYCPEHQLYHPRCRKPDTGMPEQAKVDFPEINFSRSIMVGDFATDIIMGHKLGMQTVFVHNETSEWHATAPAPDFSFPSLLAFAQSL